MDIQQKLENLEKRVQELEARESIKDAISAYSWAVDTENWALMEAIFTDNAVCENRWRGKEYIGKKAIVAFFQQHRKKFKFTNRLSNLNERITVSGKEGEAVSYFLVMYTLNGESTIGWGTYTWEARREDDNVWRISRLVLEPTLMSTLEKGWGMETGRVVEAPPLGKQG
jgi:ketosteroid isomerase-like protein